MKSSAQAGILVLVWVNGIMYLMRQFLGGAAHRVSPIALIASTAVAAAAGLFLFGMAATPLHRVRRRGALRRRHRVLVADDARASRRSGSHAAARWCWRSSERPARFRRRSPDRSWAGSTIATARITCCSIWAILPAVLALIFTALYLSDRVRGGYRVERIGARKPGRMNLDRLTFPIVQISLDLTSLDEALETAAIAVEAGVDWLEAGTPLLLAEGLRAVETASPPLPRPPDRRRSENDGWRLSRDGDDGEGRRQPRRGDGPCARGDDPARRRRRPRLRREGDGRQPRRRRSRRQRALDGSASASTSSSTTSATMSGA